jgi:OmcA/MtrC family decaheme c-type cytochrome
MARTMRTGLASCALGLILAACSDGGGDRAPGVETGPVPPNGPVTPPPPDLPTTSVDASALSDADVVVATITGVSMASPPTVSFTLVANGLQSVSGVDNSDGGAIRASLASLTTSEDFGTLDWTSTILVQEDPICRSAAETNANNANNACTNFVQPGVAAPPDDLTVRKVNDPVAANGLVARDQITTEAGGTLVASESGNYAYTLVTDPGDAATLPDMHRVCLQISLNAPTNNACIDFVPADLANLGEKATSLDDTFYQQYDSQQIVADDTCNSCHDQVALHGGGRTAMDYCVTCHNAHSTDANSENSVDFKVMVHRIHNGRNLPSNSADNPNPVPYTIWGFNNGKHDFSNVSYPQNIIQCTRCHAGQEDFDYAAEQGLPVPRSEITRDGHSWVTYQAQAACESCHDNLAELPDHPVYGESACAQCHRDVQQVHRDNVEEHARALSFEIESTTLTGPDESPVITFAVKRDGTAINIQDPASFDGKLRIGVAWDAATDFDNDGISGSASLNIEIDPIADAERLGEDNRFQLNTAPNTIPADKDTLGIMLFGHEKFEGDAQQLSVIKSEISYAASTADNPTARRQVVDINKCDDCHHRLSMTDTGHVLFHAAPAENPQLCTGCHGPGLSLKGTSTDYRVLVHGVHAGGIRQTPYLDKFGTDNVQYPGDLADCEACHLSGTYTLPSAIISGPLKDAGADQYSTPTASACASCHDSDSAKSHMVGSGGALFNVPQATAEAAIESCDVCHKSGASASVEAVHNK